MDPKISGGIEEELGLRLKNIELSRSEGKVVELGDTDVQTGKEECDRSLLGKIVGDRKASLLGLKRTLTRIWQISEPMEYLILHEMEDGLTTDDPVFKSLNLWVQACKIPMSWLTTEVGMKIGGIFQEVKNVVVVKGSGPRGNYLRLLVSINLEEQLPRGTSVKLHDQVIGVTFLYEKLVNLCYYCGKIGHLDRSCSKRMADMKKSSLNEGQFGEWMKAMDYQYPYRPNSFHSQSNNSSEGIQRTTTPDPNSSGSRKESAHLVGNDTAERGSNVNNMNLAIMEIPQHSETQKEGVPDTQDASSKLYVEQNQSSLLSQKEAMMKDISYYNMSQGPHLEAAHKSIHKMLTLEEIGDPTPPGKNAHPKTWKR
ncbi:Unknown protein [Striga hermonthica]|uniref:CCHC-type domain-containing protein n=1 Tax=Striga hermonthica TaxID=68872 RepID=A0A9N7P0T2_STRHE|nr:Unknown protein [Striga hermonthica]